MGGLPQRLEDLGADMPPSHLAVVAASDDATQLWATSGGLGWRGHRAQGSPFALSAGSALTALAQGKSRVNLTVHVEAGDPKLVQGETGAGRSG